MTIFQGEIYWIDLGEPQGSEPAYLRPCVVVQNDALNQSQIGTVIVCPLTTNLRRAKAIGNVLLNEGEGNLPESSVVNVSQVFTVDKRLLTEWLFSTLCDNFCLWNREILIRQDFYCYFAEETISIDLVSTQKPEEPRSLSEDFLGKKSN